MQIVSNLHEMCNHVFWEKIRKKNIITLSSAELAQRMAKVNEFNISQCKLQHFLINFHVCHSLYSYTSNCAPSEDSD